jgi:hypothetical protein
MDKVLVTSGSQGQFLSEILVQNTSFVFASFLLPDLLNNALSGGCYTIL